MATINYWGLSSIKDSVTVALTITVDQLIAAIAADEGLPTDYYKISLLNNPAINDVTYGDSSTTLTAMGIVDGDTILCTPNQVGTKEDRQIQKLEIAKVNRARTGRNDTYNRDDLPTKYTGNAVTDNPNGVVGGTITGITIATPLTRSDGANYLNPGNVTIQFANPNADGGYGTDKALGTPVIVAGKLSGINVTYGGVGYAKRVTVGILNGQVLCDIFVIDSTSGNPDTREIRDITTPGVDVTATDITSTGGLVDGRPWS